MNLFSSSSSRRRRNSHKKTKSIGCLSDITSDTKQSTAKAPLQDITNKPKQTVTTKPAIFSPPYFTSFSSTTTSTTSTAAITSTTSTTSSKSIKPTITTGKRDSVQGILKEIEANNLDGGTTTFVSPGTITFTSPIPAPLQTLNPNTNSTNIPPSSLTGDDDLLGFAQLTLGAPTPTTEGNSDFSDPSKQNSSEAPWDLVTTTNGKVTQQNGVVRLPVKRDILVALPGLAKPTREDESPENLPQSPDGKTDLFSYAYRDAENEATRHLIFTEIVESERRYVVGLRYIINSYMKPLQEKKIITTDIIGQLFSITELLLNFHEGVLKKLDTCLAEWSPNQLVSPIFLEVQPFFAMYFDYVHNYRTASTILADLQKSNPSFNKWMQKTKDANAKAATKLGISTALGDLLITPIQRLPRYKILLEKLFQNTSTFHPDYRSLEKTLEAIGKAIEQLNERQREAENQMELIRINELLEDYSSLMQPSRRYIHEGDVTMYQASDIPKGAHASNNGVSPLRRAASYIEYSQQKTTLSAPAMGIERKTPGDKRRRGSFTPSIKGKPATLYLFSDLILLGHKSNSRLTGKPSVKVLMDIPLSEVEVSNGHSWTRQAIALSAGVIQGLLFRIRTKVGKISKNIDIVIQCECVEDTGEWVSMIQGVQKSAMKSISSRTQHLKDVPKTPSPSHGRPRSDSAPMILSPEKTKRSSTGGGSATSLLDLMPEIDQPRLPRLAPGGLLELSHETVTIPASAAEFYSNYLPHKIVASMTSPSSSSSSTSSSSSSTTSPFVSMILSTTNPTPIFATGSSIVKPLPAIIPSSTPALVPPPLLSSLRTSVTSNSTHSMSSAASSTTSSTLQLALSPSLSSVTSSTILPSSSSSSISPSPPSLVPSSSYLSPMPHSSSSSLCVPSAGTQLLVASTSASLSESVSPSSTGSPSSVLSPSHSTSVLPSVGTPELTSSLDGENNITSLCQRALSTPIRPSFIPQLPTSDSESPMMITFSPSSSPPPPPPPSSNPPSAPPSAPPSPPNHESELHDQSHRHLDPQSTPPRISPHPSKQQVSFDPFGSLPRDELEFPNLMGSPPTHEGSHHRHLSPPRSGLSSASSSLPPSPPASPPPPLTPPRFEEHEIDSGSSFMIPSHSSSSI